MATEAQRQEAIGPCHQSDPVALGGMKAFASTDFRVDLEKVGVPTLVQHGASDAMVPFEGSNKRPHAAIAGSGRGVLEDAPHGCNTRHADEFNQVWPNFLRR